MELKKLFAVVAVVPIFALFLGVGILATSVGETWTEATTAALVTGLTTVCGGGAVVIGLILAIVVGFPFAIRLMGDAGVARRTWVDAPPPPPSYYLGDGRRPGLPPAWREDRPPLLEAKPDGGQWISQGPQKYDLWEEAAHDDDDDFDDRFARRI